MDTQIFSKINRERCESPSGFNHPLNSWSTSDWMTAFVGEVGEAANIVKKLNRVRDGIREKYTRDELIVKLEAELADAFIYLDLLFQSLDMEIGSAVAAKFQRTSEEIGYPKTYAEEYTRIHLQTIEDRIAEAGLFRVFMKTENGGGIYVSGELPKAEADRVCDVFQRSNAGRKVDFRLIPVKKDGR